MANVDVGSRGGKRRSLDSELNMVPMIDLLMATISFLLLSAVWTHMSRIDADARVPGRPDAAPMPIEPEKQLHVTLQGEEKFVLAWKRGNTTVESIDVPRREVVQHEGAVTVVRFPDLAARIAAEWRAKGQHASPTDRRLDQAVLHTDDKTEFKYLVGVIDAVYDTRRDMSTGSKIERRPAFNVTFAVD
jgi:biopolymer transport protein ExbD